MFKEEVVWKQFPLKYVCKILSAGVFCQAILEFLANFFNPTGNWPNNWAIPRPYHRYYIYTKVCASHTAQGVVRCPRLNVRDCSQIISAKFMGVLTNPPPPPHMSAIVSSWLTPYPLCQPVLEFSKPPPPKEPKLKVFFWWIWMNLRKSYWFSNLSAFSHPTQTCQQLSAFCWPRCSCVAPPVT